MRSLCSDVNWSNLRVFCRPRCDGALTRRREVSCARRRVGRGGRWWPRRNEGMTAGGGCRNPIPCLPIPPSPAPASSGPARRPVSCSSVSAAASPVPPTGQPGCARRQAPLGCAAAGRTSPRYHHRGTPSDAAPTPSARRPSRSWASSASSRSGVAAVVELACVPVCPAARLRPPRHQRGEASRGRGGRRQPFPED